MTRSHVVVWGSILEHLSLSCGNLIYQLVATHYIRRACQWYYGSRYNRFIICDIEIIFAAFSTHQTRGAAAFSPRCQALESHSPNAWIREDICLVHSSLFNVEWKLHCCLSRVTLINWERVSTCQEQRCRQEPGWGRGWMKGSDSHPPLSPSPPAVVLPQDCWKNWRVCKDDHGLSTWLLLSNILLPLAKSDHKMVTLKQKIWAFGNQCGCLHSMAIKQCMSSCECYLYLQNECQFV